MIGTFVLTLATAWMLAYSVVAAIVVWRERPPIGRDYDGWPRAVREVRRKRR